MREIAVTVGALIQAAGQGLRLGLGPKAFVELDGEALLLRAVRLFQPFASQVLVAVAPRDIERARLLLSGTNADVMAGGETRSATTRLLIEAASTQVILLHDVVHPFASPSMIRRLLDAAIEHGAAAPAILNTAFAYDRAGAPLHAPGQLLMGQKPVAFLRSSVLRGYAAWNTGDEINDPSLMEILERAGVRTHFVEGSSTNIKITTPDDLKLAEALVRLSGE